jgi:hypothetical protein
MDQTRPNSLEELERRSRELRAQRERARLLFHCYAVPEDDGVLENLEDAFYLYYSANAER